MTLSITILCYYAECQYAECLILFTIMLNVVMLNVVMLSVIMLSVIMTSVVAPQEQPAAAFTKSSQKSSLIYCLLKSVQTLQSG